MVCKIFRKWLGWWIIVRWLFVFNKFVDIVIIFWRDVWILWWVIVKCGFGFFWLVGCFLKYGGLYSIKFIEFFLMIFVVCFKLCLYIVICFFNLFNRIFCWFIFVKWGCNLIWLIFAVVFWLMKRLIVLLLVYKLIILFFFGSCGKLVNKIVLMEKEKIFLFWIILILFVYNWLICLLDNNID